MTDWLTDQTELALHGRLAQVWYTSLTGSIEFHTNNYIILGPELVVRPRLVRLGSHVAMQAGTKH